MLNKMDPPAEKNDPVADKKEPVVIKKYANRRLTILKPAPTLRSTIWPRW